MKIFFLSSPYKHFLRKAIIRGKFLDSNIYICMYDKSIAYFTKFMIYFKARHIESRDFSRVGRISHAVFCLHHLLPYVGNIGTIGTNGTIGKTLNEICLPMVPFLQLEKTTNARHSYEIIPKKSHHQILALSN